MSFRLFFFLLGWMLVFGCSSAQNISRAEFRQKAEDEARYYESVDEWEKAVAVYALLAEVFPKEKEYVFRPAYIWYESARFDSALFLLEPLINSGQARAKDFHLFGNCLDDAGYAEDARKAWQMGLEKFPAAGELYLELGIQAAADGDTVGAAGWWERGIAMDPDYASNYYFAALAYCHTREMIRPVIYGEIFLLLERNSERTSEISDSIFAWYQEVLEDEEAKYSGRFFSAHATDLWERFLRGEFVSDDFEDRFNLAWYSAWEPGKDFSAKEFHHARIRFLSFWIKANKRNSHPLFRYLFHLQKAGHFEAYNYWLFADGNSKESLDWKNTHIADFEKFEKWFAGHPYIPPFNKPGPSVLFRSAGAFAE